MKYDVKCSCGHTTQVDIMGTNTHGERDRKLEYQQKIHDTRLCPECYAKSQVPAKAEIIRITYADYKNKPEYSACKTVSGSYNAKTKTIEIYTSSMPSAQDEQDTIGDYRMAMAAMMDDEHNDGINPPKMQEPAPVDARTAALNKAEAWGRSAHDVKASAGKKAANRISAGEDHEKALEDMDAEWSEYCRQHMFD